MNRKPQILGCALALAAMTLLGGCGLKGPLYLPAPAPATASPATTSPAPATAPATPPTP